MRAGADIIFPGPGALADYLLWTGRPQPGIV